MGSFFRPWYKVVEIPYVKLENLTLHRKSVTYSNNLTFMKKGITTYFITTWSLNSVESQILYVNDCVRVLGLGWVGIWLVKVLIREGKGDFISKVLPS